MYELITGDILNIDRGIVVHQVNCQGIMGAGLAKAIKEKYPIVFEKYKAICNTMKNPTSQLLGKIQVIQVEAGKELYIVNLFAQNRFGTDKRYTDYDAFETAFSKVVQLSVEKKLPLYIPERIGCSLAGGDWDVVKKIINEELIIYESHDVSVDCTIVTTSTDHLCEICLTNSYTQLCDYNIGSGIITSIDFQELPKTCDRRMFRSCATTLWKDCDVCPEHAVLVRESLIVSSK